MASIVEQKMGWDENNDWFYGIIGGMELDTWMSKSTYADNNTRHFDEARFSARKQAKEVGNGSQAEETEYKWGCGAHEEGEDWKEQQGETQRH